MTMRLREYLNETVEYLNETVGPGKMIEMTPQDLVNFGFGAFQAFADDLVALDIKIDQRAAEIDASIKHLTEQLSAMVQARGQSDQMRAHSLQLALQVGAGQLANQVDANHVVKMASEFHRFLKGQDRHDA